MTESEPSEPTRREPTLLTQHELAVGGAAQSLLAIYFAVLYLASATISMVGFPYEVLISPLIAIIDYPLFVLFVLLLFISMARVASRTKRNAVGLAAAIFGLNAAVAGILYHFLVYSGAIVSTMYPGSYTLTTLGWQIFFSYSILLGLTAGLLGAFFLVFRKYSKHSDLWLVAGILYVFSCMATVDPFFSYLAAQPLNILVGAVGAYCFLSG
ncbi:MAG: hypothetical protein WED04_10050 [Promethearchaeati archaeon SRVP18_Atabeyarchaeia-1]